MVGSPKPGPHPATGAVEGKPRRARAIVPAVLAAVLALGCAVAAWAAVAPRAPENLAVADTEASKAVTDQVTANLKLVLSYNYTDLDRTRRAADRLLVADAAREYRARFAAVRETATTKRLVRSTTVSSAAVRWLRGDAADLFLFVDQQTLATGANRLSSSSVAVEVEARKVGETWKLAAIRTL